MAKKRENLICFANVEAIAKNEKTIKFGEFGIGFYEDDDSSQAEKFFINLFRNKPNDVKKIKLRVRSVNFVDGTQKADDAEIELDFD